MLLPYDGDKYFTRQAHEDVVRARSHGADRDDALVGFLAFSDYGKTDLGSALSLDEHHGSYPIEVRLPVAPRPNETDSLLTDDSSCVVAVDYKPRAQPEKAAPIRLDIEVRDPDNADISWPPKLSFDDLRSSNIMRQVDFIPDLSLFVSVQLNVPSKLATGAHAMVKEVFIGWPTRTSLSSLKLQVNGQDHQFWYNPERAGGGGLEWHDVPMTAEPESEDGDICIFRGAPMTLFISKPGDLYHQDTFSGQVDVTIDRLLSGADARLFDAAGNLCRKPACEMESVISTKFSVTLDDAFARRIRSPYQQMHFDEVILTGARVDDITTALRNRGFAFTLPPEKIIKEGGETAWWLIADRPHGPDTLSILIYVSGKRYRTRRQRQVEGGIAYQTMIESGDLQLYVYGFLRGDSKTVIQEMNALRRALRERFDRLPDRR